MTKKKKKKSEKNNEISDKSHSITRNKDEQLNESKVEEIVKTEDKEIKEDEFEEIKEQEEIIQKNKFQEFIRPKVGIFSPVLEKVGEAPESIDLEQVAESAPFQEQVKEKQDSKYLSGLQDSKYLSTSNQGEAKYQSLERTGTSKIMTRSSFQNKMRRPTNLLEKPEIKFTPSQESRVLDSVSIEKYISAERLNSEDRKTLLDEKRDLLERKEIKYTLF